MRTDPEDRTLRTRRAQLVAACRAAARAQATAGAAATDAHEAAVVAALAALHEFDSAHPHLVDLAEDPLQIR